MKKTIAYAIVNKRGNLILDAVNRQHYIYKIKKEAELDCDGDNEKIIKVEIREVK